MTEKRLPAALLAVMVHLFFLAILVFGFRWQTAEPVVLQAKIWKDLPPVESHRAEPVPKPVPKPLPKPAPPPPSRPAPQPAAVHPDIALKKAREEKKREDELKAARLQELARKREERLKQEKLQAQKELEKQKQIERQKALEKQKELQAQREKIDALNRMVQQRAASAKAGLIDQYKARIHNKIKQFVVVPSDMKANPEAEFDVVLLPDGEVLKATLVKSSGYPAYDAAVERAILRASPLPLPPDPSLFEEFRNLDLIFRPGE